MGRKSDELPHEKTNHRLYRLVLHVRNASGDRVFNYLLGCEMKHSHYYKTLPSTTVDVYRVLQAFDVTDPCLQHAAKKILCAGNRGVKDCKKDIGEAMDSLVRWFEMRREEEHTINGNDLSVNVVDDLHWNEHHEARMDVIGSNGNCGSHYFDMSHEDEEAQV